MIEVRGMSYALCVSLVCLDLSRLWAGNIQSSMLDPPHLHCSFLNVSDESARRWRGSSMLDPPHLHCSFLNVSDESAQRWRGSSMLDTEHTVTIAQHTHIIPLISSWKSGG